MQFEMAKPRSEYIVNKAQARVCRHKTTTECTAILLEQADKPWLVHRNHNKTGRNVGTHTDRQHAQADLPISSKYKDVLHEVFKWGLIGNCVVHEGSFEGVVLVIANNTGRQCVVAHQVSNDATCRCQ